MEYQREGAQLVSRGDTASLAVDIMSLRHVELLLEGWDGSSDLSEDLGF